MRRVRTGDGQLVDCDFAVVGIGVTPRVKLADRAGLKVENGILVNEKLQTSSPSVFAAGDVANAWHPRFEQHIRVEHWANALHQGPAAARAMLGEPVSYDRIPYFFSDQYDVGMEYSGYATSWDEIVFRGQRESGESRDQNRRCLLWISRLDGGRPARNNARFRRRGSTWRRRWCGSPRESGECGGRW